MQAADYMDACDVLHPNVMTIYRVWDSEAPCRSFPSEASTSKETASLDRDSETRMVQLWVVMELCEGGPLTAGRLRRDDGGLDVVRVRVCVRGW